MFYFYEIKCQASPKEFAYFYLTTIVKYPFKNDLYRRIFTPDKFRLVLYEQGYEIIDIKRVGIFKYFYHKYFKKPKNGYKVFWEKENL
jgi:hypothetical protein